MGTQSKVLHGRVGNMTLSVVVTANRENVYVCTTGLPEDMAERLSRQTEKSITALRWSLSEARLWWHLNTEGRARLVVMYNDGEGRKLDVTTRTPKQAEIDGLDEDGSIFSRLLAIEVGGRYCGEDWPFGAVLDPATVVLPMAPGGQTPEA